MDTTLQRVIVIGTSMGGLKALKHFFSILPDNLPVAIMVVQHLFEGTETELPFLIRSSTKMQVKLAEMGEKITAGVVYVGPTGKHLMVQNGKVLLGNGFRDNGNRPSINDLFRSASADLSQKTIGILLTGLLSDGSEGLKAIKNMGGVTIVQDPNDADFPDMPSSAIRTKIVDYITPVEDMGTLLKVIINQEIVFQKFHASSELLKSIQLGTTNIHNRSIIGINENAISTDDSLANILQVMQERTNMLENRAESELLKERKQSARLYFNRARESRIHTENLRNLLFEKLPRVS